MIAEEEGRNEKDAREEATAPPDAGGLGSEQATGFAGPGSVSSGGADQTTGLAGPRGVRDGSTTPVGDLVDLGGHDLRSGMGMGSTLAPQA